jgi:hypothetical protein
MSRKRPEFLTVEGTCLRLSNELCHLRVTKDSKNWCIACTWYPHVDGSEREGRQTVKYRVACEAFLCDQCALPFHNEPTLSSEHMYYQCFEGKKLDFSGIPLD